MNERDHLEYLSAKTVLKEDPYPKRVTADRLLLGLFITDAIICLLYFLGIPIFGWGTFAACLMLINLLLYFIAVIMGKRFILLLFLIPAAIFVVMFTFLLYGFATLDTSQY
ncbi:hypothetical protein [Paenibacillus sp. Marseille-Q4541]|uniref:hypothetical protein n=1 Tax=Paenibacillus sp. Marseille-Q4541 TaxID=2831522 RepID=UPI001BA5A8B9|nr:hypothetical protein [Paenibacillus sp. Marseille-Q4541]